MEAPRPDAPPDSAASAPAPGVLRTPDARFQDLPDWPFAPRYLALDGLPGAPGPLRVHYVDAGDDAGEGPVLLLHGEPTWSYLYRHVIPPVAERRRVVAPDFVGFGRSDKLPRVEDYTFRLHRQTLVQFFEALDLRDVTVVVQDWGGLVGLPTALLDVSERVARIVILNTFLPVGHARERSPGFVLWRGLVERSGLDLDVRRVMRRSLPEGTPDAVLDAYGAPFPSREYRAGAAAWPLLVPVTEDDPLAETMREAREALARWEKPVEVLFSDDDPILGGAFKFFRRLRPDAPAVQVEGGGHFLQDARGAEIARAVLDGVGAVEEAR